MAAPRATTDEEGRIAESLLCVACGYNVRGLLPHDNCPECGAPINAIKSGSNFLRHADRIWIGTLYKGMILSLSSIAIMFSIGIVSAIVLAFLGPPTTTSLVKTASDRSFIFNLLTLVFLIPYIANTIGVLYFTEPEPHCYKDPPQRSRIRLVWMILTILLLLIVPINSLAIQPVYVPVVVTIASVPIYVMMVFLAYVSCGYMKLLSIRIPSSSLAAQFNFLKWGLSTSLALLFLQAVAFITLAYVIMPSQQIDAHFKKIGTFFFLIYAVFMLFAIWHLLLTIVFTVNLRRVKQDAIRFWRARNSQLC